MKHALGRGSMRKVFRDGKEWTPTRCFAFINALREALDKDPIPHAGRQNGIIKVSETYSGVYVYGVMSGRSAIDEQPRQEVI